MPRISSIPSGAISIFKQPTAITGWTKMTADNIDDYTLRVVNTSGGTTGGSYGFSTIFVSLNVSGSVPPTTTETGGYTLSGNDIPAHTHPYKKPAPSPSTFLQAGPPYPGTYVGLYPNLATGSVLDAGNWGTAGPYYSPSTPSGYPAPIHATMWGGATHTHPVSLSTTFTGGTVNMAIKYVDVIRAQKN